MKSNIPPLRLILNTECNGKCNYCHNEGSNISGNMSKDLILECARIAQKLSLPHISITGGEPTLRKDLADIINEIMKICTNTNISLTSNGYKLHSFCNMILSPIYSLNLSITSFNKEIAFKYQKVDPDQALQAYISFPAKHKNLNVVVVEENYLEICDIIDYCIKTTTSLDIMFNLKEQSSDNFKMQQHVLRKIESLGNLYITLGTTPVITYRINENCRINIKHHFLSSLITRNVCTHCTSNSNCAERICAVRVYPNMLVSSCLNHQIISNKVSLEERICEIYSRLSCDFSLLNFLI